MDTEDNQEEKVKHEVKQEVGQKSPFAGCAIVVVAIGVMVFLVGFSIFSMFRQFGEISKFTGEKAVPRVVVELEGREAELNRLAEKVEVFRLLVGDKKSAVLELNVAELNLAIAVYDSFKDLRGMLEVVEISPKGMRFGISFQLNGKPRLSKGGEEGLMASDPRFLNGVMVARPGLLQREVVLEIVGLEVVGAVVPVEFVQQMSPYRIAERYVGSEGIGVTMAGLTGVSLGEGVIRFEKEAGVVAKDTITNAEVDGASRKLFTVLGFAAVGVLLFVGVVVFVGMRLKKSRESEV